MIDKHLVQSFLRSNGVELNAPTATVEAMLMEAHWQPDEIKEAILVYTTDDAALSALAAKDPKQSFRPDMDWSSSKLSSLLGIDVIVDPKSFRASAGRETPLKSNAKKMFIGLGIAVITLAIAVGLGIGVLYFFEMGPFYTEHVEAII